MFDWKVFFSYMGKGKIKRKIIIFIKEYMKVAHFVL